MDFCVVQHVDLLQTFDCTITACLIQFNRIVCVQSDSSYSWTITNVHTTVSWRVAIGHSALLTFLDGDRNSMMIEWQVSNGYLSRIACRTANSQQIEEFGLNVNACTKPQKCTELKWNLGSVAQWTNWQFVSFYFISFAPYAPYTQLSLASCSADVRSPAAARRRCNRRRSLSSLVRRSEANWWSLDAARRRQQSEHHRLRRTSPPSSTVFQIPPPRCVVVVAVDLDPPRRRSGLAQSRHRAVEWNVVDRMRCACAWLCMMRRTLDVKLQAEQE